MHHCFITIHTRLHTSIYSARIPIISTTMPTLHQIITTTTPHKYRTYAINTVTTKWSSRIASRIHGHLTAQHTTRTTPGITPPQHPHRQTNHTPLLIRRHRPSSPRTTTTMQTTPTITPLIPHSLRHGPHTTRLTSRPITSNRHIAPSSTCTAACRPARSAMLTTVM